MPCCLVNIPQGEGLLQRGEDSQQCHAASGGGAATESNATLPQGEGLLQRGEDSQQCHAASGGGAATER